VDQLGRYIGQFIADGSMYRTNESAQSDTANHDHNHPTTQLSPNMLHQLQAKFAYIRLNSNKRWANWQLA